jgi:hypothetical protein
MALSAASESVLTELATELLQFAAELKVTQPTSEPEGARVVELFRKHMLRKRPRLAREVDAISEEQELCMWTAVAEELDWPQFDE